MESRGGCDGAGGCGEFVCVSVCLFVCVCVRARRAPGGVFASSFFLTHTHTQRTTHTHTHCATDKAKADCSKGLASLRGPCELDKEGCTFITPPGVPQAQGVPPGSFVLDYKCEDVVVRVAVGGARQGLNSFLWS